MSHSNHPSLPQGIEEIYDMRSRLLVAQSETRGAITLAMATAVFGFTPRRFITRYEAISQVTYRANSQELVAVVALQGPAACAGSLQGVLTYEFVRFYVDFGDGEWVDMGYKGMPVHNRPANDPADEMRNETHSYEVKLPFSPMPRPEVQSSVPRVKAILCWNMVPPPNDPDCESDFAYIWADKKEVQLNFNQAGFFTDGKPARKVVKADMAPYRRLVQDKPVFGLSVTKKARKEPGARRMAV
jgi:hypothetical protein